MLRTEQELGRRLSVAEAELREANRRIFTLESRLRTQAFLRRMEREDSAAAARSEQSYRRRNRIMLAVVVLVYLALFGVWLPILLRLFEVI